MELAIESLSHEIISRSVLQIYRNSFYRFKIHIVRIPNETI